MMSECEMSLKECLGCSASEIAPKMDVGSNKNPMVIPCRLYCKVTSKYIDITKCIKEA